MARLKKKATARLEQRRQDYDKTPPDKRLGTKRPGSTNYHQR